MAPKGLGSAVYLAQMFLSQVLGSGGTGIDATAGTAMTHFSGKPCGPRAKSMPLIFSHCSAEYPAAPGAARLSERVQLLQAGHEEMEVRFQPG